MKKILCLLFISIVAVSVTVAYANEQAYDENSELLSRLKILSMDEKSLEDKVTREDFALYIARMLNIDTETKEYTGRRYFTDVEHNSYSAYAINILTERGYVQGYGDDKFMPQKNITTEEASKLILSVMGYDMYVDGYGINNTYTAMANRLGIIKGYSPLYELNYGDLNDMLVNALMTDVGSIDSISKDSRKYGQDEGKTILSIYRGAYFSDGTITDVYGSSLEGQVLETDNTLRFNGHTYSVASDIDEEDYFGNYVRILYFADKPDEGGEVFFIMRNVQRTEDIEIDISLFKSYNTGTLEYYRDEDASKISKISIYEPITIYNGLPLNSNISSVMSKLNKGTITVKDRNNDGKYDTVIFDDYRNFVVGNSDLTNEVIYNALDNTDSIRKADFDMFKLVNETGDDVGIDTLTKDMVLSVKQGVKGGTTAVKIVSGGKVFNGVFEEYDGEYAKVGGRSYKIEKTYLSKFEDKAVVGETYYFSTDIFDNIAYVTAAKSDNMKFGYILKKNYSTEIMYNISDKRQIMVLNDESKREVLNLAQRVKIDGRMYREYAEMLKCLAVANGTVNNNGVTLNSGIIMYRVNDVGNVVEIDTPYIDSENESQDNSLIGRYTKEEEETAKWFCADRFGLRAVLNGSTKVFFIPNSDRDNPSEELCAVGKYTLGVISDEDYYGNAYYVSSLSGFADAAVIYYKPEQLVKYAAVVVSGIWTGLNAEGEIVSVLAGYENGTYTEFEVDRDISLENVGEGDLVSLNYGFGGNILKSQTGGSDVTVIYDASEKKCVDWKNITDNFTLYNIGTKQDGYRESPQFSFGYVSKRVADVVAWGKTPGREFNEEASLAGIPVVICDSSRNKDKVYLGKTDDILDYESAGNDCDSIIFMTSPRKIFAVIYR